MPNSFEHTPKPRKTEPEEQIEQRETITLSHPEIYQSPEWNDLPKISRGQILLVAEGAKPGTIVKGNFTGFQKIVKKMGLATSANTEDWDLDPVYEVASPDVLTQHHHELVSLPEETPEEELHRINGRFLGYPQCCTEEYINPTRNRKEITEKYGEKKQKEITNMDYEVQQLIEQGEEYPEELDYCPPTFTPCSATCPNALKTLSKWKQFLEAADPEAAERIKKFNWQDEPFCDIHQDEIAKEEKVEMEDEKIRFLRKSTGSKK